MSFFFEFPHTRTYDSDLGWLIHAYQLLKAQADDIQGSIQQIVDETLNDPTYVARVLAVLAPLNVKYPPSDAGLDAAKGDGVTDDTDAITGMIAYAYEHGMPLLFPAGQYVVSGLTVSNDITFIGLGGTLFLKAGAVNPLITVKGGYLTATGLEFNGNIAGQTVPKNVFVVDGGGFKLDNCIITGGVDGIHADIDTPSFLTAVDIRNFTEYGIYVEGTSFINANGLTMDVASGGALRLMRVDASNCVFNGVESLAEVAIAFEVTGDFNYFLARVPNVETPTSDDGQNNNFEIIAQLSKRTYQNLSEKVAGDYTQEVGDFDGTATEHYSFSGPDIILKPTNSLTYKAPVNGKIPFKDYEGNEYNVITDAYAAFVNVKNYGAVGDGVTDDTDAFKAALADMDGGTLFIPNGDYIISDTLTIDKPINIYGASAYMDFAFGYYGSVIHFKGNVQTLFDVKFSGTNIENLILKNESNHENPYGIALSDVVNEQTTVNINHVYRCIYITDFGAGILQTCQTVFECLLEKCWANGCTVGFLFTSGTSITFLNCWTTWCKEVGYNLQNNAYCSFINCAADNNAKYSYSLINLLGCSLVNCGCETTGNDTSNITSPVVSIVNCKNVDFSCLFSSCKGIAGDVTLLIQMTGSSYVKIHDCTLVGDASHKFDWLVLDSDGKNNSLYNIVNNLTGFTPNARINGQDIGIKFVLETKAATE